MTGYDQTSDILRPPRWSALEPMTFDARGVCQEPRWLAGLTRGEIDRLTASEWTALKPHDANSRFLLIDGGGVCARPKAGVFEGHQCGACTDDLGFGYDRLIKVRIGSCVHRGRLEGGSEWWACARCGQVCFRAG